MLLHLQNASNFHLLISMFDGLLVLTSAATIKLLSQQKTERRRPSLLQTACTPRCSLQFKMDLLVSSVTWNGPYVLFIWKIARSLDPTSTSFKNYYIWCYQAIENVDLIINPRNCMLLIRSRISLFEDQWCYIFGYNFFRAKVNTFILATSSMLKEQPNLEKVSDLSEMVFKNVKTCSVSSMWHHSSENV